MCGGNYVHCIPDCISYPSFPDLRPIGGKEMISYLIPLVGVFLQAEWVSLWLYPLIALAFLASIPRLIRSFER